MKATAKLTTSLATSLACALATAASGPAFAQPSEQVIVPSPYSVQQTNVGPTRSRTITMSQAVPVGDLDLKTGQGMSAFQGRVQEVATGLCREMDRRYPKPAYTGATVNDNCTATAMRQAMAQVEGRASRIAQAEGAPKAVALAQNAAPPNG